MQSERHDHCDDEWHKHAEGNIYITKLNLIIDIFGLNHLEINAEKYYEQHFNNKTNAKKES